jgi:probable HAF family extracellular repeat protein
MKQKYRRKTRYCLLICFAVVLQTYATVLFGQTYTFVTIDVPNPDRQIGFTTLTDINDEGQIVGLAGDIFDYGFVLNFKKKKGFRTTKIRCPGIKNIVGTVPQEINNHGEITGWAYVSVDGDILIKGFFRNKHGKCTIIDFPEANLIEPTGLNDAGQVVGDYRDANTGIFHGFLWEAGQFSTIDVPFPEAISTAASGINNVGQIVGSYSNGGGFPDHGFLYENGIFTSFDFPTAISTNPDDINDNGQIVGFFVEPGPIARSFVLDDGTFATFDVPFPGVLFTEVRGINNEGQIVGAYVENKPDDFPRHGFLASPNVNSPLIASLTEGERLDPKEPNPVSSTDETQKVVTNRQAGDELCRGKSVVIKFSLAKAGLCNPS